MCCCSFYAPQLAFEEGARNAVTQTYPWIICELLCDIKANQQSILQLLMTMPTDGYHHGVDAGNAVSGEKQEEKKEEEEEQDGDGGDALVHGDDDQADDDDDSDDDDEDDDSSDDDEQQDDRVGVEEEAVDDWRLITSSNAEDSLAFWGDDPGQTVVRV